MELRELIQSTVAELDELVTKEKQEVKITQESSDEKEFLEFIKSRTEVLFLGLQAKEVACVEDKLEITLKYLEFLLATVDERLAKLSS